MAYQWLHEFCQKYGFSSTVEHLLTEMNLTELRNLIVFKQNLLCLKDELAYAIESETRANDCSSLAAIQPTFNDIDLITQACADDLYLTTPPPPLSQLPSINTVLNPSITSAMSSPFSMNYLEAFDTLDFAEDVNEELDSNSIVPSPVRSAAGVDNSINSSITPVMEIPRANEERSNSAPQLSFHPNPHAYYQAGENSSSDNQKEKVEEFSRQVQAIMQQYENPDELNRAFLPIVREFRERLPDGLYRCKICNKTRNRADHLKTHLARHADLRFYACCMCEKLFMRQDDKTRHEKKFCPQRAN